jgi:hypothetical protein
MANYPLKRSEHNTELRLRCGEININGCLVSFLYELMRDHLHASVVEKLVECSMEPDVAYTNGWLARYAEDLAKRLRDPVSRKGGGQ